MGGGVCVLDYDGDGSRTSSSSTPAPGPATPRPRSRPTSCLTLYRNKGDGTFEDVTAAAGLTVTMYGMGALLGDFDNDGWPDVFVTGVGGCKLFRNVPAANGSVDSTT